MSVSSSLRVAAFVLAALGLPAVSSAQVATFVSYGAGCGPGGRIPVLTGDPPQLGLPMDLALTNGPANQPAALFLGYPRVNVPLFQFGGPGCSLLVVPLVRLSGGTDALGKWTVTLTVPHDNSLVGGMFQVQYVIANVQAGRLEATNGGEATVGL